MDEKKPQTRCGFPKLKTFYLEHALDGVSFVG